MKQQLNALLSQEMDRKNFLKYVAAAGIMAVGGGVILQSLGGLNKLGGSATGSKPFATTQAQRGYGSSAYGGEI